MRHFKLGIMSLVIITFSQFIFAIELYIKDQNGQPLPQAVIEIVSNSSQPASNQTFVVDQVNKLFVPDFIVIPSGASVDFPNSDNIRHHVYSFSKAKPFELKLYSGQPKEPISFSQPGVVVLGCNIHDTMVGHIYIAQSESVFVSNKQGKITLPQPLSSQIATLWHKKQVEGPEYLRQINLGSLESGDIITISTVDPEPANTFQNLFKNARN